MKKYNAIYFLFLSFTLFIGCNTSDQSDEDTEETLEEVVEMPAPSVGKNSPDETEDLENTMAILEADEIIQGIAEKGRAILYINFDVDKATLRPDGKAAVREIATALKKDLSLDVSIEGHTDDSGTVEHSQQLSENRAQTVLNELVTLGINKSRMQAVGHGQEHPLTLNDSEESKAKNRRVELVKL